MVVRLKKFGTSWGYLRCSCAWSWRWRCWVWRDRWRRAPIAVAAAPARPPSTAAGSNPGRAPLPTRRARTLASHDSRPRPPHHCSHWRLLHSRRRWRATHLIALAHAAGTWRRAATAAGAHYARDKVSLSISHLHISYFLSLILLLLYYFKKYYNNIYKKISICIKIN